MDYGPCPNCFARDAELSWRENYAKCKPCGTEFRKSCEDTAPIDKMAALCLDGCPRKFAEQIVSLQDKLTALEKKYEALVPERDTALAEAFCVRKEHAALTQKDITNNDLLRQAESRIGYLEGENRKLFAENAALTAENKRMREEVVNHFNCGYPRKCDECTERNRACWLLRFLSPEPEKPAPDAKPDGEGRKI